ncbi:MAG: alpha/beta fold hydrolase [Bacteroides sp.]|nr:alpha/beta fold hydrolase [Bacteroides sp.]
MQGMTVVTSDIQFEKGALVFVLSTNDKGEINGLRFVPSTSTPASADELREGERALVVRTGEYELPGILKLPAGEGPFPVVVFVHGSGPSDRDGTLGPNKVFLDMAEGLARQGIASIRYDKRTYVYGLDWEKENEGTFDEETTDDAVSAVRLAATYPELSSVYVVGLSQGAILAPRIAQKAGDVAGIVMMAGSPRPLPQLIAEQLEYLFSHGQPGLTREMVEQAKAQADNLDRYGTAGYDPSLGFPFGAGSEAYWVFITRYDALETLRSLTVPVLILQGERDYQVTMKDFDLWRQGVADRPGVKLKSYPGLNYIFFEGEGVCLPAEYEQQKPVASYVIDDIAAFIHQAI